VGDKHPAYGRTIGPWTILSKGRYFLPPYVHLWRRALYFDQRHVKAQANTHYPYVWAICMVGPYGP